jgi:tetratricopeptide (TPR) repeat protein
MIAMDKNQDYKNELSPGRRLANALLLIGVGTLVYLNSLEGSFVYDDVLYLNETQKTLWSAISTPNMISRPFIGFTLYLNYAISGHEIWSYHLLNLLVHLFAALCLYGIVRRTLLTDKLADRFANRSATLALLIALLWMIHPLNTQAVTYMIQRCESIMGLFYLLTLYCAIRSFTSSRKGLWYVAAMLACTGGALSKQVIVTAPIMVLLYDYLFVADSLKSALHKRWPLYMGLVATWGVLAATLLAIPADLTASYAIQTISPSAYFLSEFKVIIHYLRLSLYPVDLSLDYGWPKAAGMTQVLPFAIPVLLLQGATLWGIYRRKPQSFLGAWFFGILAVSSSFMPIADLVVEHRMYLSLAAVVAGVVLGGDWLMQRLLKNLAESAPERQRLVRALALAMVTVLGLGLGLLTVRRNMDYTSELVLWRDNVQKQPQSGRSWIYLGKILMEKGFNEEAVAHLEEGLKYMPRSAEAHLNIGLAWFNLGRVEEAKEHFLIAAQRPTYFTMSCLGKVYLATGEMDKAVEQLSSSLELQPDTETQYLLGVAYAKQGKYEEALRAFDKTLQIDAKCVDALNEKALLLINHDNLKFRNPQEAMVCATQAVAISKKRYGKSLDVLGQVYADAGRYAEAIEAAQQASQSLQAKQNKAFAESTTTRLKIYLDKAKSKAAKT